ncbi:DUF6602 domain-containing protein [Salimicrobium salexigens]|uniref:DUF6602 domain-containing protein n=1 Tax=Salimicrobium salexigens TaxID=908941 RepID=A0ABY1L0E8_9BACI|nr:DUF6602 domain-containing protein [Salimicrobium salexigens]SIS92432.1 hypothetical protein SAMN05421758_11071 [Salimicrobium salexigens]
MNPNSLEYQKSIAREFNATKDRIRYLIGSTHWGEEGRYKEVILMNFLKRFLPDNVGIGTGFIKEGENISTQIDIIIYDPQMPAYFKENDFIIVKPESVMGIIEVKSNPDRNRIAEAVFKANQAGEFIQNDSMFNGLFIFGDASKNQNYSPKILEKPREGGEFRKSLLNALSKENGVNHIVSNDGAFLKKWEKEGSFNCYEIKELATTYFFSNLMVHLNKRKKMTAILNNMHQHLFPIREGKTQFFKWEVRKQ